MDGNESPKQAGLLELLLAVAVMELTSLDTGLDGGSSLFREVARLNGGIPLVESRLEHLEVLSLRADTTFLLPLNLGFPFL